MPADVATSPTDLVYVGEISKAHGIRGEVSLHFVAESSDILRGSIFLSPPSSTSRNTTRNVTLDPTERSSLSSIDVEKIRMHHGAVLLTLKGITDRTEAEKLRRCKVYVPREKLPELSEDEYYIADMLNLAVIAKIDGKERTIGYIASIDSPAGQELWTIITPENKEILFPAVPEFVDDIDLDAEVVKITPPPGLLDLYEE